MHAGDIFLIPDYDDHLWAIISDPAIDAQNVVMVLFVTRSELYADTCILRVGDHPFIKHDTCVQYPGAKVVSDCRLEELRREGKLRMKARLNENVTVHGLSANQTHHEPDHV
jgi:hypothetical protein